MNDERFQRTVGAWLRDEDPATPDSIESARQVAARLPSIRQQGRWWPLPLLRRSPTPTRAVDTVDVQSGPILATNGQSPTVIGRTSSMLSPVKAITAGAIAFAIGGVMLIAQPFQQQGSAPGAAAPEPPVAVSGTVAGGDCPVPDTIEVTDGLTTSREGYCNPLWALDDPRFGGTVTWAANYDFRPDRTGVEVGTYGVSVVDDGGAWRMVPEVLFLTPAGPTPGPLPMQFVMDGEGAYEGYFAVFSFADWNGDTGTLDGYIVHGELPPVPDAVSGS